MERYSKQYSSKWQSQYSEEFKRHVCIDFLTGNLTRRAVEHKFKLGNSRLDNWLKELGYNFTSSHIVPLYAMSKQAPSSPEKKETIEKLKKELEDAKLLAESYRRMIELAEQEFKINIQKKSNTK